MLNASGLAAKQKALQLAPVGTFPRRPQPRDELLASTLSAISFPEAVGNNSSIKLFPRKTRPMRAEPHLSNQ